MKIGVSVADVYYRLSVEEANRGESSSIVNQRKIVTKYCEEHGITIVKEFVDDGFSGSNFDRPGFQQMLKHIKTGLINTVITKDLSRLGRDMTESSYYAETFFPEHGIKYIAISDNFNSESDNAMAPFQFAMNDFYLRDTSRKIKLVLNNKRENGEYCACPPFGYMKNPKDKTKIIPDPVTAPIVQRIFALAREGYSAHGIASVLTDENCITPLKYRVMYRDNFGDVGAARATDIWNHTTVKRILRNPVYLGHTVLGKTKKASIKSKKKIHMPEDEWYVTLNTHEALVSKEDFETCEMYMGMHTKSWKEHPDVRKSIFNGVAYCSNCGGAMCSAGTVYKGERMKYWYLSCNNISNKSHKCDHGARIKYSDFVDLIRDDLNLWLNLSDEQIAKITSDAVKRSSDGRVFDGVEAQIKHIEKRLGEIDKIIIKLYHDNAEGIIDDERLAGMVKNLTQESNSLKKKLSLIEAEESTGNDTADAYNKFFALTKKYTHIEELTEDIVRTFIERIEIGEKVYIDDEENEKGRYTQNIKIVYRFIGDVDFCPENSEKQIKSA